MSRAVELQSELLYGLNRTARRQTSMSDRSASDAPTTGVFPTAEVSDAPERERYEISVDGVPAGFAAYRVAPGLIAFLHTEIDERFQGQGLGDRLIAGALDDARRRGLMVLPFCPFVKSFIQRHPEYVALVPEVHRQAFEL